MSFIQVKPAEPKCKAIKYDGSNKKEIEELLTEFGIIVTDGNGTNIKLNIPVGGDYYTETASMNSYIIIKPDNSLLTIVSREVFKRDWEVYLDGQQWEYESVSDNWMERARKSLDDYGKEGWELISVVNKLSTRSDTNNSGSMSRLNIDNELVYFFKRRK